MPTAGMLFKTKQLLFVNWHLWDTQINKTKLLFQRISTKFRRDRQKYVLAGIIPWTRR